MSHTSKRIKIEEYLGARSTPSSTPKFAIATPLAKDSRRSALSSEEKVSSLLQRHPQCFSEELGIDLKSSSPDSLWQWFVASILFSARIKSDAAIHGCHALFRAGLDSPFRMSSVPRDHLQQILHDNFDSKHADKATASLLYNTEKLVQLYGGDLNKLREVAKCDPGKERSLLKKFKGVGDGSVDIFFREAQWCWTEHFPFADRKALKAARLVGLREHPESLADLCSKDRLKYIRLIAALVRIELSKQFHEF